MAKCSWCEKRKWSPHECILCTRKYCDNCKTEKYFSESPSPTRPKFKIIPDTSIFKVLNFRYSNSLWFRRLICPYCHYTYLNNAPTDDDLCENVISDTKLIDIFMYKAIRPYDIIIIYDEQFHCNNSVFFFLNDMFKFINYRLKIGKAYPYEMFFYTTLESVPYRDKKNSQVYKNAFSHLPHDVENTITSYDNTSLSQEALAQLAHTLIHTQDNTGKTQAIAGFLTICAKYEINISPFDDCTKCPDDMNRGSHITEIEETQRTICANILRQYASITPFHAKPKKAIVVVPTYNYPSNQPQRIKPFHKQMQHMLDAPTFKKICSHYKIGVVEKGYKNGNSVRLDQQRDKFLLTY